MSEQVSARLILAGCVVFFAGAAVAETGDLQKRVAGGNAEAGKRLAMRCKACHTLEKDGANKLGPNLWGIIGRPKAKVEGFTFSNALAKLDGNWTLENLDKFRADPEAQQDQGPRMLQGVGFVSGWLPSFVPPIQGRE